VRADGAVAAAEGVGVAPLLLGEQSGASEFASEKRPQRADALGLAWMHMALQHGFGLTLVAT